MLGRCIYSQNVLLYSFIFGSFQKIIDKIPSIRTKGSIRDTIAGFFELIDMNIDIDISTKHRNMRISDKDVVGKYLVDSHLLTRCAPLNSNPIKTNIVYMFLEKRIFIKEYNIIQNRASR